MLGRVPLPKELGDSDRAMRLARGDRLISPEVPLRFVNRPSGALERWVDDLPSLLPTTRTERAPAPRNLNLTLKEVVAVKGMAGGVLFVLAYVKQ